MYYEHAKGLSSELKVIDQLTREGWDLLHHRFKTKMAEVDLVMTKGNRVRIIEVKSISDWDFVSYRVGIRQKQKLIYVFRYFQERFHGELVLEMAFVPLDGKIVFIEIEG